MMWTSTETDEHGNSKRVHCSVKDNCKRMSRLLKLRVVGTLRKNMENRVVRTLWCDIALHVLSLMCQAMRITDLKLG